MFGTLTTWNVFLLGRTQRQNRPPVESEFETSATGPQEAQDQSSGHVRRIPNSSRRAEAQRVGRSRWRECLRRPQTLRSRAERHWQRRRRSALAKRGESSSECAHRRRDPAAAARGRRSYVQRRNWTDDADEAHQKQDQTLSEASNLFSFVYLSSAFQQTVTFSHASGAVRRAHRFEGQLDGAVEVEALLVHQVVEPSAREQELDFAEHRLDRVELRTVADVEDRVDVEALHQLSHSLGFVDGQLVEEQCERSVLVFAPQVGEEVLEVVLVGDLGVDVEQTEAVFFGHGCDHSPETSVHVFLVDCEVGVLGTPLFRLKR